MLIHSGADTDESKHHEIFKMGIPTHKLLYMKQTSQPHTHNHCQG